MLTTIVVCVLLVNCAPMTCRSHEVCNGGNTCRQCADGVSVCKAHQLCADGVC